jgi:hypothetical protein
MAAITARGSSVQVESMPARFLRKRPAVRASGWSRGGWLHKRGTWRGPPALGGCFVSSRHRPVHAAFCPSAATDCAQL